MPTPQPLYSSRFVAEGSFNGGPTTFYVVPAGKLAVVKYVGITVGTNVLPGRVDLAANPGGVLLTNADGAGLAAGRTLFWWGMHTMYEGEELYGFTFNWTGDIVASGYLLSAP